jgi:hypothetical protein
MRRNSGIIGERQKKALSSASGVHGVFDQYNSRTDGSWPSVKKVTSIIGSNGSNFDENVLTTFTVRTEGFPQGATVYYSIATVSGSALTGSDFDTGSLTGSFTVDENGTGTISITPVGDGVAENNTSKIQIRRDSVSGEILGESATLTMTDADLIVSGQQNFTSTGQSTFTVPTGVTSVNFLLIGGGGGGSASTLSSNGVSGGGGGGGALSWRNGYTVTPGQTLYITVGSGGSGGSSSSNNNATAGGDSYVRIGSHSGTIVGRAGGGAKGLYNATTGFASGGVNYSSTYGGGGSVSGGGNGGKGGCGSNGNTGGGGGGAGGYSGQGGQGSQGTAYNETGGWGGGGGGGTGANSLTSAVTFGGGGVGILGEGTSGGAGHTTYNKQGSPGSGGTNQTYGGGGAGAEDDSPSSGGNGAQGAVRIIWGSNRSYPSTNTGDV